MGQPNLHHKELALSILARVPDLTLASVMPDGSPHASTVSFASDGLVLYAAVGIDSQKAHNVRLHPQIALTITAPYKQWSEIQALSMSANAEIVSEPDQMRLASRLLLTRFPQFAKVISDASVIPWPGTLYLRLTPKTISLINYAEGFGHTSYFTLTGDALTA